MLEKHLVSMTLTTTLSQRTDDVVILFIIMWIYFPSYMLHIEAIEVLSFAVAIDCLILQVHLIAKWNLKGRENHMTSKAIKNPYIKINFLSLLQFLLIPQWKSFSTF